MNICIYNLYISLRRLLKKDSGLWSHPWVKKWISKRWRNLFIRESALDNAAVNKATKKSVFSLLGFSDYRSDHHKVAERFLKGSGFLFLFF